MEKKIQEGIPLIKEWIELKTPDFENNDNFNEYVDFWGEMADRSFKVLKKLLMSL